MPYILSPIHPRSCGAKICKSHKNNPLRLMNSRRCNSAIQRPHTARSTKPLNSNTTPLNGGRSKSALRARPTSPFMTPVANSSATPPCRRVHRVRLARRGQLAHAHHARWKHRDRHLRPDRPAAQHALEHGHASQPGHPLSPFRLHGQLEPAPARAISWQPGAIQARDQKTAPHNSLIPRS